MLPTPVQGQPQHLKYQNRIKKTRGIVLLKLTTDRHRASCGLTAIADCRASVLHSYYTDARFYELGLTRDSGVIPGLTVVSVLSTSNLGLNWD